MDIIFIQGGGEGGYEADEKLVASLQQELGEAFTVHYPRIFSDETLPDFGWLKQIGNEISCIKGEIILVGHSLGASMMLKYLSENKVQKILAGIFLLSPPFWSGDEDWVQGLKLKDNFVENLTEKVPVFLYHCRDDEIVPSNHLTFYRQKLPGATVREIKSGGHQFDNGLSIVAEDIFTLLTKK